MREGGGGAKQVLGRGVGTGTSKQIRLGCRRSAWSVVAAFVVGTAVAALAAPAGAAVVGSSPAAGRLVIESDGADAIAVACAGDRVRVNEADLLVGGGTIACSALTSLEVDGGPGANVVFH